MFDNSQTIATKCTRLGSGIYLHVYGERERECVCVCVCACVCVCVCDSIIFLWFVHNRTSFIKSTIREESVELAIRVSNNSSESNVTSGLAHVTIPNA